MLAQLRSVTPALSESDINREHLALEEAIKKVETETARHSDTSPRLSLSQPEPASSVVRPQYISRTPVVPRFTIEKRAAANPWSPRWRNLSLAITAFLVPALAAAGVLKGPGIIASFHSTSNFNGARETAALGAPNRIGSASFASSSSNDSALVTQKVMLYEQDEAQTAGKRFRGTAAWRAENVSARAARAAGAAIRADIEIPEQRIGVHWTLRNNDDKEVSASHTIEIMFTLPPNFSHGDISEIPGVLMKRSEFALGVPLAGLSLKVASNFFVISLSSAEADKQHNVELLRERSWFDVPIVFDDGHQAIIAIEKGASGERAFSETFAAWEE
jgi:hypothetical protein